MVSVDEAIKTIEKAMPNFKILNCTENKTFFFFGMQPKRLWGTDEIPSGGSSYVVWKDTGKFDMISFDLWDDEKFEKLILNDPPKKVNLEGRAS